jgi:hypothetical protein
MEKGSAVEAKPMAQMANVSVEAAKGNNDQ